MSAVPRPAGAPGTTLLNVLTGVVRPEFTGELIRIDPTNPVFARGRCQVVGCGRGAWTRMLCNGHYGRWHTGGQTLEARNKE